MSSAVGNILQGKFLTDAGASRYWSFILFGVLLAMVMIGSSHSAEKKVHKIARLNNDVRELRSKHVDQQQQLMHLKMESTVARSLEVRGILPASGPPHKIIVKTVSQN